MESELQDIRFGFQTTSNHKDTNFLEYYCNISEKKKNSPGYGVWSFHFSLIPPKLLKIAPFDTVAETLKSEQNSAKISKIYRFSEKISKFSTFF
jgi:hypothetical protein